MEFHDYIINYPMQNDKNIQMKTTLRQEFYELRGAAKEKVPIQGEFFKHQDLFMRYVRQYDRILNIHETGTGKTGSIINTSESFRDKFGGIKQVVIIEPGSATLEDFKSQIVKFFPEKYDDDTTNYEHARKRNIKKKLNKWYVLDTYEAFSNKLSKMSKEEIEYAFSDTLFFLDEAHRMRNYGEEGEDENIYINIWKLLHITKRIKVVIGTATPLVNSVNDFVPLMNLLLPMDSQMPLTNWDYSKVTLQQLEPYLRGKISFVRSLDTGIKIEHNGVKLNFNQEYMTPKDNNDDIPIVVKQINDDGNIIEINSPVQTKNKLVKKYFKSEVVISMIEMKKDNMNTLQHTAYNMARLQKQSFELATRESATFVFPDGTWGARGFTKYIEEKDKVFKFKNNDVKEHIKKNTLNDLSCKFNFYMNRETEASNQEHPGSSFCYLEFVKGSGVILLGLLLEIFGFKNYTKISSAFVRDKGVKKINPSFKPAKRFALITSETDNLQSILELFNSPENIDGKYIQIIIASKIARDGINLANVKRGYIMSPGWHESGMYQALSRFIRATSHKMLLDRDNEVTVDIYKLAACSTTKFETQSLTEIKENSIDCFNYLKSEEKDLYNRIILRDMKTVAFDALLNYRRNHRNTDNEFSKEADYGPKFPDVWSNYDKENVKYLKNKNTINQDFIETNTKKLLYNESEINKLDRLVRANIKSYSSITIDELTRYAASNNIDNYYVYLYINNYIRKLDIDDRFGNRRKIIQIGNIFVLDRGYYHFTSSGLNYLPIIENTDVRRVAEFYDSVNGMNRDQLTQHIRNMIWKLDAKNKAIVSEITPAQDYIIDIIEDCIVSRRNKSTNNLKNMILNLFVHYINKANYPTDDVAKVKESYEKVSSKAGRTAKKYSKSRYVNIVFEKKDTDENTTYYHFFNIVTETNNIANIFRREDNKVRLLKPNSNTFVDADINELPIFQKYYKKDIDDWIKYYERRLEDGISSYGTVMRDNKFRIIKSPFDKSRGTVCGTNKEIPYEILSKINLSTENINMIREIMPNEIDFLNKVLSMELEEINKKTYPEKTETINEARQKYFWSSMLTKPSKQLCKFLENFFKYKNKLLLTL